MVIKLFFKKSYVAIVDIISDTKLKNNVLQGYGRNSFDAVRTAILNLVELLIQDEKYVDNIKESLKIFMKIVILIYIYYYLG